MDSREEGRGAAQEYQTDYSRQHPEAVFDRRGRERKAAKIQAILDDAVSAGPAGLRLLDVGGGGGAIPHWLAASFGEVVGLDIDVEAVRHAARSYRRENLWFLVGDAMAIPLPDGSCDAVVCAHVYEHVPDADRLLDEIDRVLRPGGVCFFSAGSRLALREPHYGLLFLSWLPRPLAHRYLRLTGRGRHYYERHLGYWRLRRLAGRFDVEDYTLRVIRDPARFAAEDVLPAGSPRQRWAHRLARVLYPFLPGYLWVLRKRS